MFMMRYYADDPRAPEIKNSADSQTQGSRKRTHMKRLRLTYLSVCRSICLICSFGIQLGRKVFPSKTVEMIIEKNDLELDLNLRLPLRSSSSMYLQTCTSCTSLRPLGYCDFPCSDQRKPAVARLPTGDRSRKAEGRPRPYDHPSRSSLSR